VDESCKNLKTLGRPRKDNDTARGGHAVGFEKLNKWTNITKYCSLHEFSVYKGSGNYGCCQFNTEI
jgi:hypothetical protein